MTVPRKLLVLGGIAMMGDALAYALGPSKYVAVWRGTGRVRAWARMLDWLDTHRALCGLFVLGEGLAGASLVRRAEYV